MNNLSIQILLNIRSNQDTSELKIRGYTDLQIITEIEKLLENKFISLGENWVSITDKGLNAIKNEGFTKDGNRISIESGSQISKLTDGELYIPQESEIDF